jgi:taurine dioxygenase
MPDSLSTLLSVQPLNPTIGAVVRGVDLGQPLGVATIGAINRAFAARFGALHVHPVYPHVKEVPEIIILDTHPDNQPDNDNWHTDVTFIETPPLGAVLAAKDLPSSGGDTSWSSSIAAFEALSPPWQAFLTGLTALHDFAKSFPPERFSAPEERERWQIARDRNPPVIHPVVRTHPVSGRKGLFVNEGFTTRITGFSAKESDAVLRFLFEHVAKPEFTVRWRWKAGDVAFWDNRCTQHYALADYLPNRRVMHRATILGDRPV